MKKYVAIISFVLVAVLSGCDNKPQHHACYNAEMDAQYGGGCTMDCPGVCGCDGKSYCNTCEAYSEGIEVVSQGACPP